MAQTTIRVLEEQVKAQKAVVMGIGAEMEARQTNLGFIEKDIDAVERSGAANFNAAHGRDVTIEGLRAEAAALGVKIAKNQADLDLGFASLELLRDKEDYEKEANKRRGESIKLEDEMTEAIRRGQEAEADRAAAFQKEGDLVIAGLERKEAAEAASAAEFEANFREAETAAGLSEDHEAALADAKFKNDQAEIKRIEEKRRAIAQALAAQGRAIHEAAMLEAKAAKGGAAQAEAYARSAAKSVIGILATQAAAAAAEKVYEAVAFPYNIPLSAIAGAAAYAAIRGIGSKLNRGGVVPGDPSNNRDTVPIMATAGEVYMSQGQVVALRGLMMNLGAPANVQKNVVDRARGGGQASSGAGPTSVIQISSSQMFPDQAVSLKAMRRQSRTVKRLQRQGMFPTGAEG